MFNFSVNKLNVKIILKKPKVHNIIASYLCNVKLTEFITNIKKMLGIQGLFNRDTIIIEMTLQSIL